MTDHAKLGIMWLAAGFISAATVNWAIGAAWDAHTGAINRIHSLEQLVSPQHMVQHQEFVDRLARIETKLDALLKREPNNAKH